MYFFVGGLCNTERYFEIIVRGLGTKNIVPHYDYYNVVSLVDLNVQTFEEYCNHVVKTIAIECDVLNYNEVCIVSFSMGCLVSLKSTIALKQKCPHVKFSNILINPANIFNEVWCDTSNYFKSTDHNEPLVVSASQKTKRPLPKHLGYNLHRIISKTKVFYAFMRWIPLFKFVMLSLYYYTIGRDLKEPWCLLETMASQRCDDLISTIDHVMIRPNWQDVIRELKQCSTRRIKIISGKEDRYNPFARLLSEVHNDLFELSEIYDGSHHVLYFNHQEVVDRIIR